jgi:hypothetical protein
MHRHHSLGTATLVALMAADRRAEPRCLPRPTATLQLETSRIVAALLAEETERRLGRRAFAETVPMAEVKPLRH